MWKLSHMVRLKLYSKALWAIALVTDRSRLSRSCPGPPGNPHQSKVAYMPWSSEATLPSNIVTTLVSRGAICDVLMKVAPQEDTPITLFQVASKGSTWGSTTGVQCGVGVSLLSPWLLLAGQCSLRSGGELGTSVAQTSPPVFSIASLILLLC